MKKVFADHSNISLTVTKPGLYEAPETETIVADLLQATPDISVVATNGDQMAVGAIPAVEMAGKSDQVKVFGVGASQVGIEEVRAGKLYGTVVNNSLPEEQGEMTAEMALQAVRGEKIANPGIVPAYPGIPPVLTQANESEWKTWKSGWEG
jgi:ABC-type sugar transport system substrate-binding protein